MGVLYENVSFLQLRFSTCHLGGGSACRSDTREPAVRSDLQFSGGLVTSDFGRDAPPHRY